MFLGLLATYLTGVSLDLPVCVSVLSSLIFAIVLRSLRCSRPLS